MKKLFAMLLTLALSLSLLVGCGSAPSEPAAPSDNAAPSAEASAPAESGKKLQVGIVQVMEHPSLDQIRTSFLDEMARLGYGEDKVDYDYQNASGDTSNLNTICQKFAGDQKDLIVAIATPVGAGRGLQRAGDSAHLLRRHRPGGRQAGARPR